jgi:cytochrome c oxidase subunit 2
VAIAVALIALVLGTVAFHILNPWWFTPIASNWGLMDDTVNLTFWVTGAVFVAVNLFMAYAIVRYRHRKGQERRAEYEPEYKKLEWWLIGLTSVGVIAMLAPGLVVWAKFVTVPDDATVVEAVGRQWSWSFRLPGRDGELGAVDAALVGPDNPFGMDANDPRTGRRADRRTRAAPADRQAGQGAAALEGRAAQLHGAAVPGQDGPGARDDHVPVAHADADR